jgi:predicted dienelactone hydrolase
MMRRSLILALVALVLVACGGSTDNPRPSSIPAGKYFGGDTGMSPVGAIPDIVLRDEARNRDLTLNIEYPTRPGPHPLLIWSHGYAQSHRDYVGLSSYWASNGYVVIRPGHQDPAAAGGDVWATNGAEAWRNRVRDITFVLDSLDQLAQRYPELQGKIDATRVGVGGHSYGAHTAMLIGGARTYPGAASYADARVKAIVAMSPHGPGENRGLTRESWAELRVPALFVTGTLDAGATETETWEWRREAYTLSPAGDKWLVVINGARTASFTGKVDDLMAAMARERAVREPLEDPLRDPNAPRDPRDPRVTSTVPSPGRLSTASERGILRHQEIFAIARGSALAFWDTYLRGNAEARTALENLALTKGVTAEKK